MATPSEKTYFAIIEPGSIDEIWSVLFFPDGSSTGAATQKEQFEKLHWTCLMVHLSQKVS